jgi:hypothetical protein
MKNVIDLLKLYSEINPLVIKDKPETTKDFIKFTNIIIQIVSTIKQIKVELDSRE